MQAQGSKYTTRITVLSWIFFMNCDDNSKVDINTNNAIAKFKQSFDLYKIFTEPKVTDIYQKMCVLFDLTDFSSICCPQEYITISRLKDWTRHWAQLYIFLINKNWGSAYFTTLRFALFKFNVGVETIHMGKSLHVFAWKGLSPPCKHAKYFS